MGNHQQNPDGSWSEAKPLDWAPGMDWEVYTDEKLMRADLYDRADRVARVTAKWYWLLMWRMRQVNKKQGVTPRQFGGLEKK